MAEVKAAIKTEQELRVQRVKIYCDKFVDMCTPGAIATALGIANANEVPTMNNRDHNFTKFVKQHFYVENDMFADNINFSWPKAGIIYTKAYQAFQVYSKTEYGAVMIQNILREIRIPDRELFQVRRFDNDGAKGSTNFITLPSGFPLTTLLKTGDTVDPLAMIHHEFGHTRFTPGHKPGVEVSMQDERLAVINRENPARMYNKNEPRYAYYDPDKSITINIITSEEKGGIWATDKADPRIFVTPK